MFVKLFTQLLDSTLNELALHVRWVWVSLLLLCDREGVIDATPESIARRINVPVTQVVDAIEELCKPDPRSRSAESDGRRLIAIRPSYGWQIVNYSKYREIRNEGDRRDYMRDYMSGYRANGKRPVSARKHGLTPLAETKGDSRKKSKRAATAALQGTAVIDLLTAWGIDCNRRAEMFRGWLDKIADVEQLCRILEANKDAIVSARYPLQYASKIVRAESERCAKAARQVSRTEVDETASVASIGDRVAAVAPDVNAFIQVHGDPDVSDIARKKFNDSFASQIAIERDGEDHWARWVRLCGECCLAYKPKQRRAS